MSRKVDYLVLGIQDAYKPRDGEHSAKMLRAGELEAGGVAIELLDEEDWLPMLPGWSLVLRPFWFHQGYDLGTFNMLDSVLRQAMRAIVETHPGRPHEFPSTLEEWARHMRMAIGAYGAYFEAFHEPFEQYVGSGADVVWAAWPDGQ